MLSEATSHRKSIDALVLGTAQFGMPYGIANRHGQPDSGRVCEILDLAYRSGLRMLDTAAGYGKSEFVLGACGMDRWAVTTKLPSFDGVGDIHMSGRAREFVLRSLDRLRADTLHSILAHDVRDMIGARGHRILDGLAPLQDEGVLGKIGVSVYGPQDLSAIDANCAEIVQAPFNVLDQRFVTSGESAALRERGGELYVRSVFLQGLLLMTPKDRPAPFKRWASELARYDDRVRQSGIGPAAFCLSFATQHPDVSRCVVGVDTPQQLLQVVSGFKAGQDCSIEASDLMSHDQDLIDPRFWADEA